MGMLEDLRDEVDTLRKAVVRLCARAGHDERAIARGVCRRHHPAGMPPYGTAARETCATCGEFRCCAEADE